MFSCRNFHADPNFSLEYLPAIRLSLPLFAHPIPVGVFSKHLFLNPDSQWFLGLEFQTPHIRTVMDSGGERSRILQGVSLAPPRVDAHCWGAGPATKATVGKMMTFFPLSKCTFPTAGHKVSTNTGQEECYALWVLSRPAAWVYSQCTVWHCCSVCMS